MLYVTGDTHGSLDIHKLNTSNFPVQKLMTKDDFVVILGDFGLVWDNSKEEQFWLTWLKKKPWTTLFVDGNHDNHDWLNRMPVETWNGGKIHVINDSVIHLMRGQVFEITGKTIFVMGGAFSVDIEDRVPGESWWPDELPNYEAYEEAFHNLDRVNWCVDYVFTHTISNNLMKHIDYVKEKSELNTFFDLIEEQLEFKHWYFGHFHIDSSINDKYTALYDCIVTIK